MSKKQLIESVCFAVAIGALRALANDVGHKNKWGGGCHRLAEKIDRNGHKLKGLSQDEIDILSRCINASSEIMDSFEEFAPHHVLLNLAAFCMEEISHLVSKNCFEHLNRLFSLFCGSDCWFDIRLGHRVFLRLMTELEIELAQEENNHG